MENREMVLYGDKVYGVQVSKYGLENGYLDYLTLSKIVDPCILNNNIVQEIYDWDLVAGEDYEADIYQYYIITEYGYAFLAEHTDELVFYNHKLDVYVWGITHFGTSWDYVLTDIKLVKA